MRLGLSHNARQEPAAHARPLREAAVVGRLPSLAQIAAGFPLIPTAADACALGAGTPLPQRM